MEREKKKKDDEKNQDRFLLTPEENE